jgi:hypothetical protein
VDKNLLPGDPARERYALLIEALDDEPPEAFSRAVLARLCAWSSDDDVSQLSYLIRRARGRAAGACRSLLTETVEQLGSAHDHTAGDLMHATLPYGLIDRLREWVGSLEETR